MKILSRQVEVLLLIVFVFCGCATQERFEVGYKPTIEPVDNVYNPNTVITVTGIVENTTDFDYEDGLKIASLNLVDENHKRYAVSLGPVWFLKVKNVSYQEGDKITVEGSLVNFDEEEAEEPETDDYEISEIEDYQFLARKVIKNDRMLILRSRSGKPRWFRKGILMGVRRNFGKRSNPSRERGIAPTF